MPTVHLFVDHGVDRGAAVELATNLLCPGDDTRHLTVIYRWNLFLCEQRQKLILLAWVGACRAGANNGGGQHHRGANQSACKAGDADAHGSHAFAFGLLAHEPRAYPILARQDFSETVSDLLFLWRTCPLGDRSGGKSLRRSGWHSWTTRSGRGRSRSGWVPRSVSKTPGGSWSTTNGSVAPDNTVCPPWARSRNRAARLIGGPMELPSSRSRTSPVCTPMRKLIGASDARCRSNAQATASEARANAITKLSPSPCSTGRTPSCATIAAVTAWSRSATAAIISPGWVSHSRVEPSMSASSKVTVPGGSSLTPNPPQFSGDASTHRPSSPMLASMR